MKRLEFYEVMKLLKNSDSLRMNTEGEIDTSDDILKNIHIYFGNTFYAVVHGKIPYEVAERIYTKYPKNEHKIRVDGGGDDWKPIERAVDEEYEQEMNNIEYQELSFNESRKKYQQAKLLRDNSKKYISTYHIDTLEGLLIFITEMKDYVLRQKGLPETEVDRYEELLRKVYDSILNQLNPTISAYEWMQEDEEHKDIYNETIIKDYSANDGKSIREAILNFDQAVNPFSDSIVEYNSQNIDFNKVRITATNSDYSNGLRKNCCDMKIIERDSQNSTTYMRDSDGFSFQLFYRLDDKRYLSIVHYFSMIGENESNKGEVIAISYNDSEHPSNGIDVRFNLTNGTVGKTYEKKKHPATPEEIDFIYKVLLKATEYASSITIGNRKDYEKPKEKKKS